MKLVDLLEPWVGDPMRLGMYFDLFLVARESEDGTVAFSQQALADRWNVTEGPDCFQSATCDDESFRAPVISYDHGEGCSITGGHVYRGQAMPETTITMSPAISISVMAPATATDSRMPQAATEAISSTIAAIRTGRGRATSSAT